ACSQGEGADHGAVLDLEGDLRAQPDRPAVGPLRVEEDLALANVDFVAGAAVVETGVEDDVEGRLAPDALGPADEGVAVLGLVGAYWHEVGDLGDAVLVERAGDQHVRVWEVHLLDGAGGLAWPDPEATAVLDVEQAAEHRRRPEVGVRHEVDGPVRAHQRHGVEVADDSVVLDRQVPGHDSPIAPGRAARQTDDPMFNRKGHGTRMPVQELALPEWTT